MGGIVGRAQEHDRQGSGQKLSNSVIRMKPMDQRWEAMQPMIEERSTFSCTVWNSWIWACGSETSCEVMQPGFTDWKSKWIQAPPMWRRRYRYESYGMY